MSGTPRTDEIVSKTYYSGEKFAEAIVSTARALETELVTVTAERDGAVELLRAIAGYGIDMNASAKARAFLAKLKTTADPS